MNLVKNQSSLQTRKLNTRFTTSAEQIIDATKENEWQIYPIFLLEDPMFRTLVGEAINPILMVGDRNREVHDYADLEFMDFLCNNPYFPI